MTWTLEMITEAGRGNSHFTTKKTLNNPHGYFVFLKLNYFLILLNKLNPRGCRDLEE
jgi:hypothetical protein